MPSLEELCEQCVAVCEVPLNVTKELILGHLENKLGHGRILDSGKIDGIESDKNLTRLVVLLTSIEAVRYLCEEVKSEEIKTGEQCCSVRYQKAIVCELPEEWETKQMQSQDGRQSCFSDETLQSGPEPPPRNKPGGNRQMPMYNWPIGPYGAVSGFYHNIPQPPGGAEQQDGGHNMNPGQAPGATPMPPPGHGQQPSQQDLPHQRDNTSFQGPPGTEGHGQRPEQGHPQQQFQFGQFPPGGFPGYGMPQAFQPPHPHLAGGKKYPNIPFHPAMMPMQMFVDPQTGQVRQIPMQMPGFPHLPQHKISEEQQQPPQHQPSGPPPPYNSGDFKIPAQGQRMQSRALSDQDERMRKLQAKLDGENQQQYTEQEYDEAVTDEPETETDNQKRPIAEERPRKIFVSNLPSTAHEEFLEMFFENSKRFGSGQVVVSIELDEENRCAVVEFEAPEGVEMAMQKAPFKMTGQEVVVEIYDPPPDEPIHLCTIEVRGPSDVVCEDQKDTLEMYFEHKKSFGDDVESITFGEDVAYVTFMSEEVAKRVADKDSHAINKKQIHVQLYIPETKKNKSGVQRRRSVSSTDEMTERTEEEEPVLTVKVRGIKRLPSRDTVEFYFDNKRRCGGCDLQEIKSDDEDDDVLYVKYQRQEDAKAVAERSHTLENVKLVVSLYTPPKPPPSYPKRILIKGLKSTTTEDGLFNFIEAKSGCIPVPGSMVYHAEQEGIVMVTLENEPDYEKLEQMCGKLQLDGKKLKITSVPVSNCIMVSNIASEVTKDTIEFYFENNRKSNGGPVEKVVMNDDDTCFVYFEDYQVVDNVLDKKEGHELGKQKLDVKRYQECLGRPEGEFVERTLKIPESVKLKNVCPHKMKFLKNSKVNHEALDNQLQRCYTRFIWSEGQEDVILECTLTKEVKDSYKLVKTWRKEAEKNFEDFLNAISVHRLSVLQDIWQKVMDQLATISIGNPSAVAVLADKKEGFVTVVGNKPPADNLKKDINDIIQKVMDEVEKERQKITELIANLKPIKTRMLLAEKFPSKMAELYPELKVKINQNKNEIVFEGSMGNVRDAKLKMFEMKDKFATKTIENLSALSAGLFKLKQTREYIVKKLRTGSVTGVWETQDQTLEILSSSEETIDQCVNIIRGSVIETGIGLSKASATVTSSDQWQFKVEEWHSAHAGKAHIAVDSSLSKIQICSTDDVANELLEGVKTFLRYNTVQEKKIRCTKNVSKLIEKHHKHDISTICRDLQNYHVNITSEVNGSFKINGTEDGINKAENQMQKLFEKAKQKDYTIVQPGLVEHMKSPRGKENLGMIESSMPVVIGVKGEADDDDSENLYANIPADRMKKKIKVKASCQAYDCRNIYTAVADMTEMSVQVLVNAADEKLSLSGGLGKAMALKGGKEIEIACADYIKREGKLGDGDVFICTAGRLRADYLVHVIGPVWRGGGFKEEEMLEEAVFKCMQQASIKNATSMAIPAISSGAYGYPVKRATLTIVRAVKNFFREVQESPLTEVYLCDVKANTVDQFTEALQNEFHDIKTESGSESDDDDDDDDEYETGACAPRTSQSRNHPPPSRPPTTGGMGNQVNIGNTSVKITKGEIAREKVDVIVNTTAKNLDLKNGAVSLSLLKAGGQSLQGELKTNYPNGINIGEIAVSGGHNLKCTQVYHTTMTNYDPNNETGCIDVLHKLMNNCLLEAQKQNHTSIAFPAIGTGNLGFPKDIVAKQMFKAVSNFGSANAGSCVQDVRFIVYQKDFITIKAFEAEQSRWSSGEWKSARQGRKIDPAYERMQNRRTNSDDDGDDENVYSGEVFGDYQYWSAQNKYKQKRFQGIHYGGLERILVQEYWLEDEDIDMASKLIKQNFPNIDGLQEVCVFSHGHGDKIKYPFIQMMNYSGHHWATVTNLNCAPGVVRIYDSMYRRVDIQCLDSMIKCLSLDESSSVVIEFPPFQRQHNNADCGLYAIAAAFSIALAKDPSNIKFDRELMRSHLHMCLKNKRLVEVPEYSGTVRLLTKKVYRISICCQCKSIILKDKIICNGCNKPCHPVKEDSWNNCSMRDFDDLTMCKNCFLKVRN